MKKRQYRILVILLCICVMAAAAGILFILKLNTAGPQPQKTVEEEDFKEDSGQFPEAYPDDPEGYPGREEEGIWLIRKPAGGPGHFSGKVMAGRRLDGEGMPGKIRDEKEDEPEFLPEDLPEDELWEEEKGPPVVYVASDLHYQSALTTDYGEAYEKFVAESDGKVVTYLPQLLDAFIDEMIEAKPDAFLLTGDITMNGELVNHQELAEKLHRLSDAGVPVLIIPGNHDINNYRARLYFGDEEQSTEIVSLEDFTRIYRDFGWNQAISRDEASFSYIYPLRENIWLMLLDTAQYDPLNIVDGAVRPETLKWMEENLEKAKEEGIQVIVSGHHNLLQESSLFTTMCVLENSDEVVSLLEKYELPLYISGHLHLQRIQKHRTEPGSGAYGINEIVSDALSIPPCQYGVLSWDENGGISYGTKRVQVSAWAKKTGQSDGNLLNFEQYQAEYVRDLIKAQIMGKTSKLPEETAEEMAALYADIYADYCAGLRINRRETEKKDSYRSWLRYLPDSVEFKELKAMIKDSMGENNVWESADCLTYR